MQKGFRINETQFLHLSHIARNDNRASICGYLYKKSSDIGKWQLRYFLLVQNILFYYESDKADKPSGVALLEGCYCEKMVNVKNRELGSGYYFTIYYKKEGQRQYELKAETESQCNAWVEAIQNASYSKTVEIKDELEQKHLHLLQILDSERQAKWHYVQQTEELSVEVKKLKREVRQLLKEARIIREMSASNLEESEELRKIKKVQSFFRGWLCRRRWKQIVEEYICSEHAESMRKRNSIVFGLVECEEEYVQQLSTLVTCYLRPIRMAASSKKPIITHEDVNSIFLNVETVLFLHQIFQQGLHSKMENWPTLQLGDLFDMLLPMLGIYQEYVRNHHYSLQVLAEYKQKAEFSNILKRYEEKPCCEGRSLESYLTYPMHQIPRYIINLHEILAHTPHEHVDREKLEFAKGKLEELSHIMHDEVSETENIRKNLAIERMISEGCDILLDVNQVFVRQGSLLQHFHDKAKTSRGRLSGFAGYNKEKKECVRMVFLFTNHLIITTRASNGRLHLAKTCGKIPLADCSLIEDTSADLFQLEEEGNGDNPAGPTTEKADYNNLDYRLVVESKGETPYSVTLVASTMQEKMAWCSDISQCIEQLHYTELLNSSLAETSSVSMPQSVRSDPKLFKDDVDIKLSRTLNSCKVPQIRYASVTRLLDRLTDLRFLSIDFLNTFLLTYRIFTTKQTVLNELYRVLESNPGQDPRPSICSFNSLEVDAAIAKLSDDNVKSRRISTGMMKTEVGDSQEEGLNEETWQTPPPPPACTPVPHISEGSEQESIIVITETGPCEDIPADDKNEETNQTSDSTDSSAMKIVGGPSIDTSKSENTQPKRKTAVTSHKPGIQVSVHLADEKVESSPTNPAPKGPKFSLPYTMHSSTKQPFDLNNTANMPPGFGPCSTVEKKKRNTLTVESALNTVSETDSTLYEIDNQMRRGSRLSGGRMAPIAACEVMNDDLENELELRELQIVENLAGKVILPDGNRGESSSDVFSFNSPPKQSERGPLLLPKARNRSLSSSLDNFSTSKQTLLALKSPIKTTKFEVPPIKIPEENLLDHKTSSKSPLVTGVRPPLSPGRHPMSPMNSPKLLHRPTAMKNKTTPGPSSSPTITARPISISTMQTNVVTEIVTSPLSSEPIVSVTTGSSVLLRSSISSATTFANIMPPTTQKHSVNFANADRHRESVVSCGGSPLISKNKRPSAISCPDPDIITPRPSLQIDNSPALPRTGAVVTSSRRSRRRSSNTAAAQAFAAATAGCYNLQGRNDLKVQAAQERKNSVLSAAATMRVLNVIKHWMSKFPEDFDSDPVLKEGMISLLEDLVCNQNLIATEHKTAGQLLRQIMQEQLQEKKEDLTVLLKEITGSKECFDTLSALDIAEQLTYLDHKIFCSIRRDELLGQMWMKVGKNEKSPHVLLVSKRFNETSRMVVSEIIRRTDIHERVACLEKWAAIADICRCIHNYNGVLQICAAFVNSSVYRLKRTWERLPKQSAATIEKLQTLVSSDGRFKNMREALRRCDPPCIPYLGMYLTDLSFIEEGAPTSTDDSLINFCKMRMIAHVIREIQQYQQTPYRIEHQSRVTDYLLDSSRLLDEEKAYQASLCIEPRLSISRQS